VSDNDEGAYGDYYEVESFDQLCRDLLSANSSRYQAQAEELLKYGHLEGELNGHKYAYKLERNDCLFTLVLSPSAEFKQYARTYLHWRKSKKKEYIPLFFAQCEATLLTD
jgi:hypothetical protein